MSGLCLLGEFFRLVKESGDPQLQHYLELCKNINSEPFVALEPRKYQQEMANAAYTSSTLLLAPTNSGKTKVMSMVLDEMWAKNPFAKVCRSLNA